MWQDAGLVINSSNYDYVLDSGKIYLILNVLGLLLEWEGGQNPTRDKVVFFFFLMNTLYYKFVIFH